VFTPVCRLPDDTTAGNEQSQRRRGTVSTDRNSRDHEAEQGQRTGDADHVEHVSPQRAQG
jgi:hypothetical protein